MASSITTVGFVIDGPLGSLLVTKLPRSAYHIQLCKVNPINEGDHKVPTISLCRSPKEAAEGASIICFAICDLQQLEEAIVGALTGIADGTVIILNGLISPSYLVNLEQRIAGSHKDVMLIDIYASINKHSELKLLASGNDKALEKARPILSALCNGWVVADGVLGTASKIQMVDKLLLGIQIAAAAEAMALGASAGLNTWDLYEIIINAAGNSYAFETRVPQMLENNDVSEMQMFTIENMIQVMDFILGEARKLLFPLPLSAIAHQYFHTGSSCGFSALPDASIAKVFL
ncbi:hypothetical protein KP509_17G023100 [Ceratopteris richardii]|uniref:3-hydroxyisobutyrate dehydrogenase n=1 Tax=Ceratopteris richardii TaxID=49495 RepID=A0A8T2SXL9_CERRI|nr:hypothetical protein KP509_17G023100 [Ceratopteris richardii]